MTNIKRKPFLYNPNLSHQVLDNKWEMFCYLMNKHSWGPWFDRFNKYIRVVYFIVGNKEEEMFP